MAQSAAAEGASVGKWLLLPIAGLLAGLAGGCSRDLLPVERPDAAAMEPGPACSVDHWCWENPLPQGNQLWAVWAIAPDDVWAAGQSGTLLHFNGLGWDSLPALTERALTGLWGSGPDDVWASGGSGVLLHWDGHGWRSVDADTTEDLWAIWGSGPSEVWAVGTALTHFDGTRWSVVPGESFDVGPAAISGSGPDDVWIAGSVLLHDGAVPPAGVGGVRWNGHRWALYFPDLAPTDVPRTIRVAGRDDVWLGAGGGEDYIPPRMLHYDGRIWKHAALPIDEHGYVMNLWSSGSRDLWASSSALDASEHVFHFDGQSWSHSDVGHGGGYLSFGGTGPGDVWMVGGDSRIVHFDGTAWKRSSTDALGFGEITSLAGSGPTDVWAGAAWWANHLAHYDGTSWSVAARPPVKDPAHLLSLWSPGPAELWAIYDSGLFHLHDAAWTAVDTGAASASLRAIWGTRANDFWVIGAGGLALHADGGTLVPVATGTSDDLIAIAGSAPDFVDVISAGGTLLHWDGARFNRRGGPEDAGALRDIAVIDDRRWVATELGLFESAELSSTPDGGAAWYRHQVDGARGGAFTRVLAPGPEDTWALTRSGHLFHRDERGWTRSETGCAICTSAVWATTSDAWVAGHWGSILHLRR